MSITYQILGAPGCDNAVLVQVSTGQDTVRLLFDCGEGCLTSLPASEVRQIDAVFFSHLHMDHVAGFDTFVRANFARTEKPNRIFGPTDTARIIQHRLQGYRWNLHANQTASFSITDLASQGSFTSRFNLNEAFAFAKDSIAAPASPIIFATPDVEVRAIELDHRTPSLGFLVTERSRLNIDTKRMAELGLKPGPWLKILKDNVPSSAAPATFPAGFTLEKLRSELVRETPGSSFAYLTDFKLEPDTLETLGRFLQGCDVIVCESQYAEAEAELAAENFHLTTKQSASIAAAARAKNLVLIHISERYRVADYAQMLTEAQEIFPSTQFPSHWIPLLAPKQEPQGAANH